MPWAAAVYLLLLCDIHHTLNSHSFSIVDIAATQAAPNSGKNGDKNDLCFRSVDETMNVCKHRTHILQPLDTWIIDLQCDEISCHKIKSIFYSLRFAVKCRLVIGKHLYSEVSTTGNAKKNTKLALATIKFCCILFQFSVDYSLHTAHVAFIVIVKSVGHIPPTIHFHSFHAVPILRLYDC